VGDQKTENAQARLLRERAERVECRRYIHAFGTMDIY
jgi:hypothetical protein